jgi:hypothetical protein
MIKVALGFVVKEPDAGEAGDRERVDGELT